MPEPTLVNKIKMRLYENDIVDVIINKNFIKTLKLVRLSPNTDYAFLSIRTDDMKYWIEIVSEENELWEQYEIIEDNEIYRTEFEFISFIPTLNKTFIRNHIFLIQVIMVLVFIIIMIY